MRSTHNTESEICFRVRLVNNDKRAHGSGSSQLSEVPGTSTINRRSATSSHQLTISHLFPPAVVVHSSGITRCCDHGSMVSVLRLGADSLPSFGRTLAARHQPLLHVPRQRLGVVQFIYHTYAPQPNLFNLSATWTEPSRADIAA